MQASTGMPLSLITPIGYQSGDCGYCKGEESGASYYALSKSLDPEHYQLLMDRGWRRSGTLLYLPDASRSCCPHYTIRLPAAEFQASRDQRQTIYRWNRFVLGEEYMKQASQKTPKSKSDKNAPFSLHTSIHASEASHTDPTLTPAHTFTATLEPATFTEEKYALFASYQQHVHHEAPAEISRTGFKRFLCSSPLTARTSPTTTNLPAGQRLGSYHQPYRLDGRLIALAVLDLLPHAVSGVYFIYAPEYERWSLGKLSALREIALAAEGAYAFYYMGYYIHGCAKMRYKAAYRPQEVLDFEGGGWDGLDEVEAAMEGRAGRWVSAGRERARRARAEGSDGGELPDGEALYPTPLHPTPTAATASGLSLLELGMPGVLSLDRLREEVDLDDMKISLGRGGVHRTRDIVSWQEGGETDAASVKGVMAEFAACLGGRLAREVVVDFGR